ncbi:ABC transporter permease [Pseudorhodoplanes sp.]|uniref:ABC transporter permease n=1 Tax=Pseudorhodoplanes sp. TaxID=1934341 RepID=UPI003D0AA8ED
MSMLFHSTAWHAARHFGRNPLSIVGGLLVCAIIGAALFAPWLAPYPGHAGTFVDFANANQPPSLRHWFGTDLVGRDIFSRVLFGYRTSLVLGCVVLAIAAPLGSLLGLMAGYFGGMVERAIMRLTDIFLSLPALIVAMTILGLLRPSQIFAMMAVSFVWWPWYTRLVYGLVKSIRLEGYVIAAELIGASHTRILLGEILPNCAPTILTKMSVDMGLVILFGASLSYLGLGAPAPIPDLGTMVAEGGNYLPDLWWLSVSAGLAVFIAVLGFNLLGDGLSDIYGIDT